jgi:hypothetical protein
VRKRNKRLLQLVSGLVVLWLVLVGALFAAMVQPPDRFGRIMSRVPKPLFVLMAVMPFESLWNLARGGELEVGDPAPDFELERMQQPGEPLAESRPRVRLSSHFGHKPVVLVFGSYT